MDDLISRQAAIDELVRWGKIPDYNDGEKIVIGSAIGMLSTLPSAQPERKMGRWEDAHRSKWDGTFYWFIKCNNCGYERKDDDHDLDTEYKFCPNCGADMREETDDDKSNI